MSELEPILLLAIAALFLAIVAWAGAVSLNRRLGMQRAHSEELRQQLDLVRQSIGGLTAGAVGMDRRMQALEAREKLLSERQESFEIQQADEQPYGQAIRMVQQGAGAGRLVDELDLSPSEAELIVRMHGRREYA